ncbi:Speckle-type POZ protein-like [Orchesella cincta]|uniref:Speckle-type POZ protein-like n=1 Tax=Orchesella cincta TaxID=48709 RepID=A0A1D2N0D6_ORCCI|nr:Speckle-type POZ protein-like [Orchesella cincta]
MDMEMLTEKGHCTQADKENFSLTIEIPNFEITESYREIPNGNFSRVISFRDRASRPFVLGQSIDLTSLWCINLQHNDEYSDQQITYHAAVELNLLKIYHAPYDFVLCRFKISMVDKDGDLIYSKHWPSWDNTRKIRVGEGYMMPDFIVRSDIYDNKGIFMNDNTLRLKLEGILYGHFKVESIAISKQPVLPFTSLSSQLWTSMELCDVKLTSKDEKFIKAHKLILSKASPIIEALLLTLPAPEGEERKGLDVEFFSDLTELEIRKFLQYIYTGHVDQDWSDLSQVTQLISIADTYEIRGLKWLCFKNILNHLTRSNFIEVLELFQAFHAATVFQSYLHQFFLKNQAMLVRNETFQTFAEAKPDAFLYIALFRES